MCAAASPPDIYCLKPSFLRYVLTSEAISRGLIGGWMGVHGQQRIFAFCIDKVASGKGSPDNLNGSYVFSREFLGFGYRYVVLSRTAESSL